MMARGTEHETLKRHLSRYHEMTGGDTQMPKLNLGLAVALSALSLAAGAVAGFQFRWSTSPDAVSGVHYELASDTRHLLIKVYYRKLDGPVQLGYVADSVNHELRIVGQSLSRGAEVRAPNLLMIPLSELGVTEENWSKVRVTFLRNGQTVVVGISQE